MKRHIRSLTIASLAAALLGVSTTSCIGSFAMTNKMLAWNKQVGSKPINEIVFFALWVLPVYEVCGLADLLVINSIEFWSGNNPMGGDTVASTHTVKGSDGHDYLVEGDAAGYTITNLATNDSLRFDYDAHDASWSVVDPATGHSEKLIAFIEGDGERILARAADGSMMPVELSAAGLTAYKSASLPAWACR